MGINYYAVKKKPSVQSNSHIHICKLSFGWLPLFQKSDHFNTYTQLKTWLNDNTNTPKCEYVILDIVIMLVDIDFKKIIFLNKGVK